MTVFAAVSGIITKIEDYRSNASASSGCYKLISLERKDGSPINFVISPTTYFVDHEMLEPGDIVSGFYDIKAPVPLIYPPQLPALVMAKSSREQNVFVSYFDEQLVSSDGSLKLNIAPTTQIILENNQAFSSNLTNRNLIVVYGATTRSIPAQTTPSQIIVMCPKI